MQTAELIKLEPGNAAQAQAFRDLNVEWLEKFFEVEAKDLKALGEPDAIVRAGGEIVLARLGERLVGCGALVCHAPDRYEIAKMAVTEDCKGQGLGRRILVELLQGFEARGKGLLFLESNSALEAALQLYRSLGFRQEAHPFETEYARADVYMVWDGWPQASP